MLICVSSGVRIRERVWTSLASTPIAIWYCSNMCTFWPPSGQPAGVRHWYKVLMYLVGYQTPIAYTVDYRRSVTGCMHCVNRLRAADTGLSALFGTLPFGSPSEASAFHWAAFQAASIGFPGFLKAARSPRTLSPGRCTASSRCLMLQSSCYSHHGHHRRPHFSLLNSRCRNKSSIINSAASLHFSHQMRPEVRGRHRWRAALPSVTVSVESVREREAHILRFTDALENL